MKSARVVLIGLVALSFVAMAAYFIHSVWMERLRIAPGPQNESLFIKRYDPDELILRFRYAGTSYHTGRGSRASSLIGSVEHYSGFQPEFTIELDRKTELMAALRDDLSRQLASTDTRVVGKNDDVDGGFGYEYACGNSVGSISVHPPTQATVRRNKPLVAGLEDVALKIDISEAWTPSPSR